MTQPSIALPPARPAASALEADAEAWIGDYFNARHLLRTRDWVVALEAGAGEALRIAALTHDIERREPGGPRLEPATQGWDDAGYLRAHSERSAGIVDAWLDERRGPARLRADVAELILHHETGGSPAADLLQAADSLSFLEVNAGRARAWVQEGRCTVAQAQAKLDWMLERIALSHLRELGAPLHARASETLAA